MAKFSTPVIKVIGNQRDQATQVFLPLDFGIGKLYFQPDEYENLLKGGFNSEKDQTTMSHRQYRIYCLFRFDVLYLLRRMRYLYLCSKAKTDAFDLQLDKNLLKLEFLLRCTTDVVMMWR